MSNLRFKMHPTHFMAAGLLFPVGLFLVCGGLSSGDNAVLAFGVISLAVSLVYFLKQWKRLLKVSPEVEKELDRLFPPVAKRKALILLEDGFTGYQESSVHLEILKASRGDMKRLKKISRALMSSGGNGDFRDAYPMIEMVAKKLDQHKN